MTTETLILLATPAAGLILGVLVYILARRDAARAGEGRDRRGEAHRL